MKKSIILLATLFFLMLFISLISINTQLLKKGIDFSYQTKFMIQVNTLLKDIVKILESKAFLVKDETTMLILTSSDFKIDERKISLKVDVNIQSQAQKLNINTLLNDSVSTENNQVYATIENILTYYDVADKEYLLNLILDTIDVDLKERQFDTEIKSLNRNFENGKIYSMEHFALILDVYKFKINDFSVDNIPWEKLIQFDGKKIDINYMSADLLAYVLDEPLTGIKELLSNNKPIGDLSTVFSNAQKEQLEKLNITTFVPAVVCFVDIEVLEQKAKATFSYNLKSRKVMDVKIYPQRYE